MKIYIINRPLLFIFLCSSFLWAIPRYAMESGSSCILCHIDPSGGGLRSDYGIAYGLDDLAQKTPEKVSGYSGIILKHIQIGGDARIQSISKSEGDVPKDLAVFPMQANIQLKTEVGKVTVLAQLATLQSDLGFQFRINEFNGYLKVGLGKPSIGLKLPDHTVFTRGGNIKLVSGSHREGMPFRSTLKNVPLLEIGQYKGDTHYSLGLAKGYFFDKSELFYFRLEHFISKRSWNQMIGISYLKELSEAAGLQMFNVNGGISHGNISWMGEVTVADNLVLGRSIASYSELTWRIKRGWNMSGRIDFFDESIKHTEDAIRRTTFGLNYVPFPFVDIKFQIRSSYLSESKSSKGIEILSQLHFWF